MRRRRNQKTTFSKTWMNRLLWFCCIWISISYFLAFRGFVEIAQALSQTACATIIGTMAPYFLKSYFETRSEKNLEFQKEQYYDSQQNYTGDDDIPVG